MRMVIYRRLEPGAPLLDHDCVSFLVEAGDHEVRAGMDRAKNRRLKMNLRMAVRIAFVTIAVAVVALAPGLAAGQTPERRSFNLPVADPLPGKDWKPATSTVTLARTPWGDPDISGMYEPGHIQQPAEVQIGGAWTTPQGPAQPTDFGARDQAYSDPTRKQIPFSSKPFVVDPPDGKIPMQPWVLEMRKKIYDNTYTDKVE